MDQHQVTVKPYSPYGNCLLLEHANWHMAATLDYGPRICFFGPSANENLLAQTSVQIEAPPLGTFYLRGGHRLWRSPETFPGSYAPDNDPVHYERIGNTHVLRQPVEPTSGLEKELAVSVHHDGSLEIRHRITNRERYPRSIAAWGITALRNGGTAIVPVTARVRDPYTPNRQLVYWPYSDPADPRLSFAKEELRVQGNVEAQEPLKVGWFNESGWMACQWQDTVFVKRFPVPNLERRDQYPDHGVNCEIYTDARVLELESLSPIALLNHDESVELTEYWSIHHATGHWKNQVHAERTET